ncbi:mucin-binding protein [Lacticaseibacillus jixiensis]|uniref:mucin-binding protein n=1 Tax=Lacticaseibacillus jixiensis TaxID=3231926 RepID=UPI0036F26348
MPRHNLRNKLFSMTVDEKRHYKMYKDGKMWAVAGLSLFFAGTMMMAQPTSVHASEPSEPGEQAQAQAVATIQSKTAATKAGATFDVQLTAGFKAPTWTAADFTLTPVAGQADTYSVTLSAQGLKDLQNANLGAKIQATQVKAGTLTVTAPAAAATETKNAPEPDQNTSAPVEPAKAPVVATTDVAKAATTSTSAANAPASSTAAADAPKAASETATTSPVTNAQDATAATDSVKSQDNTATDTAKAAATSTSVADTTTDASVANKSTDITASEATASDTTKASQAAASDTKPDDAPVAPATETSADTKPVTAGPTKAVSASITPQAGSQQATSTATIGANSTIKVAQTKTMVDATAAPAPAPAPASNASATVDIPTTTLGFGTSVAAGKDMTALFNMTGHAGDVFTITIPAVHAAWNFDGSKVEPLPAAVGTTERTQNTENNTWTITNTFKADASVTQKLMLHVYGNYHPDMPTSPFNDIGTTTDQITYTVNGDKQTPITMTQTVSPKITINPIVREYPKGDLGNLLPQTDYVYQFTTPEVSGTHDATSDPTGGINRVVNYGTTITIPVPPHFVLNTDLTKQLNHFNDQTTIAQPGGAGSDIIITVPKGSGFTYHGDGYQLVGKYDVAPTADPKPLTASGPATLVQKLGDGEDAPTLTATAKNPWSETMQPAGDGDGSDLKVLGDVQVAGNGSVASDKLTLASEAETSQPLHFLNAFTVSYQGLLPQTKATLTITVPDGFDATGMQVPSEQIDGTAAYMPGTTSYAYTLTLADGTTQSGTVGAGGTFTRSGDSPIRKIELTPNVLAPGAHSKNYRDDDGNLTDGMVLLGTLSKTYDSGAPVKPGDQLTTSIAISVVGASEIKGSLTTQTVVGLQAHVAGWSNAIDDDSSFPGKIKAGEITLASGIYGQTTNLIKEPIMYAVLPPQLHGYVDEASVHGAKVSTTTLEDGRTLIAFDYTGTGISVDTSKPTRSYSRVFFDNLPDAVAGTYPLQLLVYSPNTPLQKDLAKVTDPILLKSVPAGTLDYYNKNWKIDMADARFSAALAQGNQDESPAAAGVSEIHGYKAGNFYVNMIDATSTDATKAFEVVNLPQAGDDQGSTFNFRLSGPVVLPSTFANGSPMNATALYSTERATLNADQTTFPTNGYVPKELVTDWGAIKSIFINVGTIPSRTETGRIQIPGVDETILDDDGRVGYLQTAFYASNAPALLSTKDSAAKITVTATDTVTARLHYKKDGQDQYIDLPDLTKQYADGKDTMQEADFPQTLDAASTALIPEGYHLVENSRTVLNLGNGGKEYDATHPNGTATFGQVAKYDFDGDVVQYELTTDTPKADLTVKYVDDDNNQVVVPVPDLKPISGEVGAAGDYPVKVPVGYELAKDKDGEVHNTVHYMITADDTDNITVHLVHHHTKATVTSTTTTVYVGDPAAQVPEGVLPESVPHTITWTKDTDDITKATTYTPTDTTEIVVETPQITGYHPDKDRTTYTPEFTKVEPHDDTQTVTYKFDPARTKVTYIDLDKDDPDGPEKHVVVSTEMIKGYLGQNATYVPTAPDNYEFATGQSLEIHYHMTIDDTDDFIIHLVHQTQPAGTVTTDYTVQYAGLPAELTPEAHHQSVQWTAATDVITGIKTYTPQTPTVNAVNAPQVDGYTPSPASVAAQQLTATTTEPTDQDVTITYSPNDSSQTVTYVDDDNDGAKVGTTATQDGKVGDKVSYTVDVPDDYYLTPGQELKDGQSVNYTLASGPHNVTIHLKHKLTYGTAETTRTINYVVTGDNKPAVPSAVTQNIKWKTVTDQVTKQTVATPQDAYELVKTPTLTCYTPDQNQVDREVVPATTGAIPGNEAVTVTYTPNAATQTVTYYDDDNDGAIVGTQTTQNGGVGDEVTFPVHVPDGYALVTGQGLSDGQVVSNILTATTNNVRIHLTHKLTYGTAETTRTINYVVTGDNAPAAPTAVVQTINWKTVTDQVTKQTVATPQTVYELVKAPTLVGYTPDQTQVDREQVPVTTGALPANETVTVTYNPAAATLRVTYVDDVAGEKVTSETVNGQTGGTGEYTVKVPTHYVLADGQADKLAYTLTTDDTDNLTVHLTHDIKQGTAATTRTITYVVNGSATAPKQVKQTVNWKTSKDLVTGESVATPSGAYYEVVSPDVPGYTPDPSQVAQVSLGAKPTADLANIAVKVTYNPDKQQINVKYVDDNNNEAQVGNLSTLTGSTDTSVNWEANVPSGYVLTPGQQAKGTYAFRAENNQDVVIHLTHKLTYGTATTTRTIAYVVTGDNAPDAPATVTQTINWKTVTDQVTKQTVATPQDAYELVKSPTLVGYVPDQTQVDLEQVPATTGALPANETVTVTYNPAAATLRVTYVDDVAGEKVTSETVNGQTGGTGEYTVKVPTHYVLADGQADKLAYTLTTDDTDNLTVHLTHDIKQGTAATTRTITYVVNGSAAAPKQVKQTVNWKTSEDLVTGEAVATPTGAYYEVVSPDVPGYTPDKAKVAQVGLDGMPVSELKNTEVTVTYKPDMQQIHVQYVDDDNDEAQVGGLGTLAGRTDTSTNWQAIVPSGYILAPGQAKKGAYAFKANNNQDVVIHLVHAKTTATVVTSYTVNYTGLPAALLPQPVTHTVEWTATTDEATGKTEYVPKDSTVASVTSPSIPGYAADIPATDTITLTTMTQTPTNVTTTVTYKPVAAALRVIYVDDVIGQQVTSELVNGHTGDTGEYDVKVPAHYVLADGQADKLGYTLTINDTDNLIVHLTHKVTYDDPTTTRTIHYVVEGGTAPADVVQTVDWKVETDEVTGQSVATAEGIYTQVISPEVPGYQPDQAVIAGELLGVKPTADLKDETVTVTYAAKADELQVTYIEKGEFGFDDQLLTTEMVTGKTGETVHYTVHIPDGLDGHYQLSGVNSGDDIAYTLTPSADGIVIYLYREYGPSNNGGGTPPTGNEDGNPPTGNEDGNPPTGNEDGNPPTGNEDGNPPTGNEDGNPPTGNEDGNPPTGNEDGNPPTGNEDGNPPTGNEDGNPPTGNEDGNPPTGNEDGNPPTGNEDGNPPTGNEDGNPPTDNGGGTPTNNGGGTPTGNGGGTPTNNGGGTPTDNGSGTPTDNGSGTPTDNGSGTPTGNGSGTPTNNGNSTPTKDEGSTPRITLPATDGDQPNTLSDQTRTTLPDTNASAAATTQTGTAKATAEAAKTSRRQLPQTGDQSSSELAFLGTALLALLGLAGWKRRKDRN